MQTVRSPLPQGQPCGRHPGAHSEAHMCAHASTYGPQTPVPSALKLSPARPKSRLHRREEATASAGHPGEACLQGCRTTSDPKHLFPLLPPAHSHQAAPDSARCGSGVLTTTPGSWQRPAGCGFPGGVALRPKCPRPLRLGRVPTPERRTVVGAERRVPGNRRRWRDCCGYPALASFRGALNTRRPDPRHPHPRAHWTKT